MELSLKTHLEVDRSPGQVWREVDVTKSMWTIDGTTLISKIGGFIGINKNFLWIITLSISSIGVLMTKLKLNHRKLSKHSIYD